jgi:biotin carboxylase
MTALAVLTSDRVDAVTRALNATNEVTVITAPRYSHLYASKIPLIEVESLSSVDAVTGAIGRLHGSGQTPRLLAATEKAVPTAGIARTLFDIPGLRAAEAIAFTNKYVMKKRWRDAGIPTANAVLCRSIDTVADACVRMRYPVVIKPAVGAGGKGTRLIRNQAELQADDSSAWLSSIAEGAGLVVEEYIEMSVEYHCDSIIRNGAEIFAAVSVYFQPLLENDQRRTIGSYVLSLEDPRSMQVRALNEEAVAALGLKDGVAHFECFETAGGLVAGEAACRPGGGGVRDAIRASTGVDLWSELVNAELGLDSNLTVRNPSEAEGWMVTAASRQTIQDLLKHPGVVAARPEAPSASTTILSLRSATERQIRSTYKSIIRTLAGESE